MGRLSLLPDDYQGLETWLVRTFLFFAFLIGGPWIAFLLYDVLLYIWRAATYELPYVGGRARGRQRPRAPSLTERQGGHKRQISVPGLSQRPGGHDIAETTSASQSRSPNSSVPRVPSKLRDQHD